MANWPTRGVYRDSAGNAVASPTVTVVNAGTSTPTTIFSDRTGTALTNPFTGDADGEWEFYAPSGTEVDITVSKTGYTTWTALWHLVGGGTDHGALAGLAGDDHPQYSLVDGSRAFTSTPGGLDHGAIGGLSDDDHAQYPLLSGRAGGQSLRGGTAASENLTLASTAHATKGKVLLGASGAYDEANVRLGVGTASPSVKGHFFGSAGTAVRAETDGAANVTFDLRNAAPRLWSMQLQTGTNAWRLVDNTGSTVPITVSAGAPTDALYIDASGNLGINGTSFGSGAKVLFIANGTAPSGTPTGGGILYVESGALKYKGSSGTITTLGAA